MKTLILFSLILILGGSAQAKEKYHNFERQIYVVDVGQVKIKYEFSGEPVSRPRRFEISVKCKGTNSWRGVGYYQMCSLTEYRYDAPTKTLAIKYIDGRVEATTGVSYCDQLGEAELPLADLCK